MANQTELEQTIADIRMVDTHEHMLKEHDMLEGGPDVLAAVFDHYLRADLVAAGAERSAADRLANAADPDIRGRFLDIEDAWRACQFTGYGQAARWIARELFGMEKITVDALERAHARHGRIQTPGERLRLLRDVAGLDHIQTDHFQTAVEPDESGREFFLYDISWAGEANGDPDLEKMASYAGIPVTGLNSLEAGIEAAFARFGPLAIAVKSQHAYARTLRWVHREDADAEACLTALQRGQMLTEAQKLCLGDWLLGRACAHAARHNLPVKLHCGYYAGNAPMPLDRVHASHLQPLIDAYPQTRFVLMHTAYPFGGEVIALAKHYPNVYADLCWAWSIDRLGTEQFVRRYLHTAPINKLFVFGGDSFWPHAAVGYAHQARQGLTRALQAEIDAGDLSEREAIGIARRVMRDNQFECFDVDGRRARLTRS